MPRTQVDRWVNWPDNRFPAPSCGPENEPVEAFSGGSLTDAQQLVSRWLLWGQARINWDAVVASLLVPTIVNRFFPMRISLFAAARCGTIALAAVLHAGVAAADSARVIDDFSDAAPWQVVASEGVKLGCREERAASAGDLHATVLRLDMDFVSGAGYGGIRRELPLDLPANFELAFSLRGDLARNNVEFKLVDETGHNVWWINRRAFEFPRAWTRLASRRRHLQFAWGPSNAPLRRVKALEIIISSVAGGRGTMFLDDLTFRPLPETKPYTGTPVASASSTAAPDAAPQLAIDGKGDTAWRAAGGDAHPQFTIDFGSMREFGGLVVAWDATAFPTRYDVLASDDGQVWNTVRTVEVCTGQPQFLALPDSEARAVRLVGEPRTGSKPLAIHEIEVLPLEASRDANAFASLLAQRSPRGFYPRAFHDEGTFWTIVGSADDERESLVSEDGAVEVDKEAFSIEPFLYVDGRLLTWAEARATQSLAKGCLPVPTVEREHDGLRLSVTAAVDGHRETSTLLLLYSVANISPKPIQGELFLAVRPFQVNPPYQWLNAAGGVARIDHIAIAEGQRLLEVDGRNIALGEAPSGLGCTAFDGGDVASFMSRGRTPPRLHVTDRQRAASAAAAYQFELAPGQERTWTACVPFAKDAAARAETVDAFLAPADPVSAVRQRIEAVTQRWDAATSTFDLLVPAEAKDLIDTIRSTLAYILINRDNEAIQPGSRSYERSWIRDGSLTGTALMRFGLEREARAFIDWYAPYQFASGKIPCVVDRRGPDPVPENDSHGQYIMAVMNDYRFSGDQVFLAKHWPRVRKAVAYIEQLRGQRMTAEYAEPQTTATRQEPGKAAVSLHAFHGLMPESISHEGYSAKPMHSYWDDFFTLRGLKDAAAMAKVLGEDESARKYAVLADDFARTLYASIDRVMQAHQIDYVPGCAELGDFDATSTTIALWPGGELSRLPRPAIDRTFERYWEHFRRRRDDASFVWADYTPYELRCIGSLVLLGHVDRAHEALEFFLRDRRPASWNQWPEIVYREPRSARFVGDLPHTWCGSDFLNSVRMLFLFEREADDAIVLLAGVPQKWISAQTVGFRNLPTYGGRLTCTLERAANSERRYTARLAGTCPIPSGGLRLTLPNARVESASVDGEAAEIDSDGRVEVRKLPATVELQAASANR